MMINTDETTDRYKLMFGDCLERMKEIEDGSVDLVLCDLPYGNMKGISDKSDWVIALEPSDFLSHCNRVLRMNGALLLFSQEPYTSKLITESHPNIPFSYRMVWEKDSFANPLLCNKAPVSYYEDVLAFFKKYDTLAQHPLRDYAKTVLKHCGGTHSEVNKRLGHRRSEHFFYINSTQFGLCTSDAYNELCEVFLINKEVWFKSYPELHDTHRRFNRRFNLQDGKKYKSNILKYKKDYTGYHPTQSRFCYLKI